MIQTPKTQQTQSDFGIYFVLLALWIAPGLVFSLAAILAGGAPHTHVIDWPYTALKGAAQGHFHPLPWQWVGAEEVRSPVVFYTVVVVVTVPALAGIILAVVALRGGIPAFFPFLSQPKARSRWAGARALVRAGLVAGVPEGQRLVVGRHREHLVALREGTSVLALGAQGSGKSAALCIPAIGDWDGCVVAVSDGTDLIEAVAGVRQRQGQVDVLDLSQRTGLGTCTWSTAAGVEMSFDEAAALVEQVLGSRDPAPDELTQQVVTCALYAAANQGVGVAGAIAWLDDLSGAALVRALLHVADRDPRATSWATRIVERDAAERAACFSAARQLLRTHFEQASPSVAGRAFQPGEFLSGAANTLFVLTPLGGRPASRSVSALLRTLVADAGHVGRRRPLLVVLDGCDAVASMPDLAEYLEDRSLAVTVLAAMRDLDECGAHAEWDMSVLVERARAVVVLGGGAGDGTDSGRPEVMHTLVRRQLARRRAPWGDRQPDLLPPDAARQLGYGRAVLVHERMAPIVVWTRSAYEDPELQRRHSQSPYVRGVARIHESG